MLTMQSHRRWEPLSYVIPLLSPLVSSHLSVFILMNVVHTLTLSIVHLLDPERYASQIKDEENKMGTRMMNINILNVST